MFKRWLKILLKVLLALFVLLFVFLLFERVRGQISLARCKRELAAKGETLDVRKSGGTAGCRNRQRRARGNAASSFDSERKGHPKVFTAKNEIRCVGKGIGRLPREFMD